MYKRKAQGWMKHADFIMLDMVCLQLAFMAAYMVRMGAGNPYADENYFSIGVVLLLADAVISIMFASFKNVLKRDMYKEIMMTFRHICLIEVIVIAYLFTLRRSAEYSRIVIYLLAILYVPLGYGARILWKRYLKSKLTAEGKNSLLVATTEAMAEEVVANISINNYERFRIAGIVLLDSDRRGQEIGGIPVVADAGSAVEYVCGRWVDEVLVMQPAVYSYPEELINQFLEMGIVVHTGIFKTSEHSTRKQFVERLGNYTVVTKSMNYSTLWQQFIKRVLDIVGGLVGTVLTCVLFVFLAPAIYISSPGSIFFSQERVGKNGRRFKMYKFRSMYPDAEERKRELLEKNQCSDGRMFKIEGDPRIIGSRILPDGRVKKGIGNYMRNLSLDEFPQFFNVLKGDMSLVGTRPPTVDEWNRYEAHHRARLAVKPGITGLWQVSGRSQITDFEDVVRLDTKYIAEWSMGMDVVILLKTIQVVVERSGAM